MDPIRNFILWLFGFVVGAVLASAWWAAALLNMNVEGPSAVRLVWLLPIVLTAASFIGSVAHLITYWKEE